MTLARPGRGDAVDRVVVELAIAMVVAIARVGEPDAASAIEREIVGAVETATFKAVDQRRLYTIWPVADDSPTFPLARVERAIGTKRTVGRTRVVVDGHDIACRRVVAANLVVLNARVEQPGSIPAGPSVIVAGPASSSQSHVPATVSTSHPDRHRHVVRDNTRPFPSQEIIPCRRAPRLHSHANFETLQGR